MTTPWIANTKTPNLRLRLSLCLEVCHSSWSFINSIAGPLCGVIKGLSFCSPVCGWREIWTLKSHTLRSFRAGFIIRNGSILANCIVLRRWQVDTTDDFAATVFIRENIQRACHILLDHDWLPCFIAEEALEVMTMVLGYPSRSKRCTIEPIARTAAVIVVRIATDSNSGVLSGRWQWFRLSHGLPQKRRYE
jgi:hypothetical protein